MGFFMASTQGLVIWVVKWVGFCCKAIGVTGVITTFSVIGCGLPTLPSEGMLPELGVAGPGTGMGGVSKTGTCGAGTGDAAAPSALLTPMGVGIAWGNPASSETGQNNPSKTKRAKAPPPAYHLNGQRLGENNMGPVQRLGL
jgi:hypothetical protein